MRQTGRILSPISIDSAPIRSGSFRRVISLLRPGQVWKTGSPMTGKIPPAKPGDNLRQAQPRVLDLDATVSRHSERLHHHDLCFCAHARTQDFGKMERERVKVKNSFFQKSGQVWKTGSPMTGKIPPAKPGDNLRQAQPRVLDLDAAVSRHSEQQCLMF